MKDISLFLVSFFYFLNLAYTQEKVRVSGTVSDARQNYALSEVRIRCSESMSIFLTDKQGNFNLSATKGELIAFSLPGYRSLTIRADFQRDTVLTIALQAEVQEIEAVTVNKQKIDTLISNRRASILDYDFITDKLVVLSFTKNLRNVRISLLDEQQDTLFSAACPERSQRFFKDCMGNLNLLTADSVYPLEIWHDSIYFLRSVPLPKFEESVFPCVLALGKSLYFGEKFGGQEIKTSHFKFNSNNNVALYFGVNQEDYSSKKLALIYDEVSMKLKRDEMDYLTHKKEASFYITNSLQQEFDLIFAETVLIKEIYAPLFARNDSILIFNFVNNRLEWYNSEGESLHQQSIEFHKTKNWKRIVKMDSGNGRFFAVYSSNGRVSLKEINPYTGNELKTTGIPYPFPENIKIHRGEIYFLQQNDIEFPYYSLIKMHF